MSSTNNLFSFLSILIALILFQCKTNKEENKIENIKNVISITKENKKIKEYYTSGKLKTEGQFYDNEKTGKWVSYYESGEIKSVKNYKNGKLDGYQKMDYSQVLYMEGHSKEGLKIGIWKSYLKKNNQLKYLKHFDNYGNAIGKWEDYYDSGELFSVENYFDNKANGKQTEYFKNGNISSVGEKRNGKNEGIWKYYNERGTLIYEREFKNGVETGKHIKYLKKIK